MAIDPKFKVGPGGFYEIDGGAGPFFINAAGVATLIASGDPIPAAAEDISLGPGGFYLVATGAGPFAWDGVNLFMIGAQEAPPAAFDGEVRPFALGPGEELPPGWEMLSIEIDPADFPEGAPCVVAPVLNFPAVPVSAVFSHGGDLYVFSGRSTIPRRYTGGMWAGGPHTTLPGSRGSDEHGNSYRYGTPGTLLGSRVYFLGARSNGAVPGSSEGFTKCEYYDLDSFSFVEVLADLQGLLPMHSDIKLDNTRILLAGGSESWRITDAKALDILKVFDTESLTLTDIPGGIGFETSKPVLCRLPSGDIFVGGGVASFSPMVMSNQYSILDKDTLEVKLTGLIPADLMQKPGSAAAVISWRTGRGCLFVSDSPASSSSRRVFSEYDEMTDSFSRPPLETLPWSFIADFPSSLYGVLMNDSDMIDKGFLVPAFNTSGSVVSTSRVLFFPESPLGAQKFTYAKKVTV